MNSRTQKQYYCGVAAAFIGIVAMVSAVFAEEINIQIGDKVLVKEVRRIGINMPWGGNSGDIPKQAFALNFEGGMARWCQYGELFEDAMVLHSAFGKDEKQVAEKLKQTKALEVGMDVMILSGPAKGQKRKIADIRTKTLGRIEGHVNNVVIVFDKKVDLPPEMAGSYTAEKLRPVKKGSMRDDPMQWCGLLFESLDVSRGNFNRKQNRAEWSGTEDQTELVLGDVPPGSFGNAAGKIKPGEKPCTLTMHLLQNSFFVDPNGTWKVSFWAKNIGDNPVAKIELPNAKAVTVAVTEKNWKKYETLIEVSGHTPKSSNGWDSFIGKMVFSGGMLLVDDITAAQEHKNPTPFRDEVVAALQRLNPGSMRCAQVAGDTVENWIKPAIMANGFTMDPRDSFHSPYGAQGKKRAFGAHEFLQLCEYIGADSWFSLTGSIHIEEMDQYMEYLGAPETVGFGKLRAKLGHPKPWTESLRRINVEFGNETWNFLGFCRSSFDASDYWHDLVERAKKSPYYKPNIIFQGAGPNFSDFNARSVLTCAPNFDSYATAPYIIHSYSAETDTALDSDDKFLRWAFGFTINDVMNKSPNLMNLLKEKKVEPSFYEFNYHITDGDGSIPRRNLLTTSLGGGVNLINASLLYQKQYGVRTQNIFQFTGKSMGVNMFSNDPKVPKGTVNIWGATLRLKPGDEHYRPFWHAMVMANKVLSGDMVETVQTGANPTFTAPVLNERTGKTTGDWTFPTVYSYALKDGKKRGLILASIEVGNTPHEATIQFKDGVKGGKAKHYIVTGDKVSATDENGEGEVKYREEEVTFQSGQKVTVPPYTMQVWQWEIE